MTGTTTGTGTGTGTGTTTGPTTTAGTTITIYIRSNKTKKVQLKKKVQQGQQQVNLHFKLQL